MGRAGQQVVRDEDGLGDRISVGLLARAFPRATVEAVVEAARAREQRTRMLPSWLVVYYVLALALFMDMGGGRVMRKLAGTLSWAARGVTVVLPSEEALSGARARLGPVPLTGPCGHRHADSSPWSCYHYPSKPKLKVLAAPLGRVSPERVAGRRRARAA